MTFRLGPWMLLVRVVDQSCWLTPEGSAGRCSCT